MNYFDLPTIFRLVLSIGLVYGVYLETGIFTSIFCLLTIAYIELKAYTDAVTGGFLTQLANMSDSLAEQFATEAKEHDNDTHTNL